MESVSEMLKWAGEVDASLMWRRNSYLPLRGDRSHEVGWVSKLLARCPHPLALARE